MGKVILVGAGPGDPGLLTVKGRQAIESAEVVVYDRLVSQPVLNLIPEDAKRINVGKEAAHHPVPQDQINQILLDYALQGKMVVRLKGGDPFLFGRGGEELELLTEHNVPFEEVPGITSAIAVPAYAGIPVTHRDYCSSLHIITGHQREGKPLEIPFDALVKTGGTLVFLMGVGALQNICAGLLKAGMDPQMPAAVIEKGTTAQQRPILSTIAELPECAQESQVQSPAIIVVGTVCSLSKQFDWFDNLPLKGRHVIVTRPKERIGHLSHRLRAMGADVTEFPCIETNSYNPCPEMEKAISDIDSYEWLVFTSPAGVRAMMDMLERSDRDVRALGRVKLAAIGPGTDRELRKHGLRADLIPSVFDGAHLAEALCLKKPTRKVLILRAQWGTAALTETLNRGKINYDDIRCYETCYSCPDPEKIQNLLTAETFVTFTSASTVKGFVAALGGIEDPAFTAVCIGRQTEEEAQKHGFRTIIAKQATIDSLIERITEGV